MAEYSDDHLEHYGVLGMKWGRRKAPDSVSSFRKKVNRTVTGEAAKAVALGPLYPMVKTHGARKRAVTAVRGGYSKARSNSSVDSVLTKVGNANKQFNAGVKAVRKETNKRVLGEGARVALQGPLYPFLQSRRARKQLQKNSKLAFSMAKDVGSKTWKSGKVQRKVNSLRLTAAKGLEQNAKAWDNVGKNTKGIVKAYSKLERNASSSMSKALHPRK